MSTRGPRMALGLLIGLAGLLPAGADAASSDRKSTAYRWVDEQGVVHYGDSIPPQYAEKEHAVLNNQGVEVGHSDAQKTPEQLAAEAKEHEAGPQAAAARQLPGHHLHVGEGHRVPA